MGKKTLKTLFGVAFVLLLLHNMQQAKENKTNQTEIETLNREIIAKDSTIIWQHRKFKQQNGIIANLNNYIAEKHGRGELSFIYE